MRLSRTVLAVFAVGIVSAITATSASAAPTPLLVKATFAGSGSYSMVDDGGNASASFHWSSTVPTLLLSSTLGGAATAATSTYGGSWTVNQAVDTGSCNDTGGFAATPGVPAGVQGTGTGSSWTITFHGLPGDALAESPTGQQDCADINGPLQSDFWHDWIASYSKVGGDGDPVVATVTVTAAQLVKGTVTIPVSVPAAEQPDPSCNGGCTTNSWAWTGAVTITAPKSAVSASCPKGTKRTKHTVKKRITFVCTKVKKTVKR